MMLIESIQVPLAPMSAAADERGGEPICKVALWEEDAGYRVVLSGGPGDVGELEGEGDSLFDALVELRRRLEERGFLLRLLGSRADVYPSGMARSMGEGRMAYRLTEGVPARSGDLVDIFEIDAHGPPATVAEQESFFASWLKSLGV